MINKQYSQYIILLCLLVCLSACKKDLQTEASEARKIVDPLAMETQLNILALNGRVESGKNNPAYNWVSPFEQATGCEVKAISVDDHAALLAKLLQTDADIVISTDRQWPEAASTQVIDYSRLRSASSIDSRFIGDAVAGSKEKFHKSLPLQWQRIQAPAPDTEAVVVVESIRLRANAKNINCAYAWMEWSLSPKVQAEVASWIGTIPVVPTACNGNALLGNDACKTREQEALREQEAMAESPKE